VRERNTKIVRKKKAEVVRAFGKLACEGCAFDFAERYGERTQGYIECHHTVPLCDLKKGRRTQASDLALVCSNCHRMIHRRRRWLSMSELQALA